jgi:hypothetical protein
MVSRGYAVTKVFTRMLPRRLSRSMAVISIPAFLFQLQMKTVPEMFITQLTVPTREPLTQVSLQQMLRHILHLSFLLTEFI